MLFHLLIWQFQMMKWSKLSLSWMGHIAAVKMKILPTFLFLFQNGILHIPQVFLNKIQSLFNKFIWHYKKLRMCSIVLKLNPQQGGLVILNVHLYNNDHHAATLLAMMQWWKSSNKLSWHMDHSADDNPLSVVALLPGNINLGTRNLNCIVFQRIWGRYKRKLISDFPLLMSFLLLPQFQQAQLASNFKNWERAKMDMLWNLGDGSGMYSEEYVVSHLGDHPLNLFQYRQVRDLINSFLRQYVIFHLLKEFELWITNCEKEKMLSNYFPCKLLMTLLGVNGNWI